MQLFLFDKPIFSYYYILSLTEGDRLNKNNLIHRAAHFVLCDNCKMHGHIKYSDGSQSIELYTVESAETEIQSALTSRFLLAVERPELMRQIQNSGLPAYSSLVEAICDVVDVMAKDLEEVEKPSHAPPPPCMN